MHQVGSIKVLILAFFRVYVVLVSNVFNESNDKLLCSVFPTYSVEIGYFDKCAIIEHRSNSNAAATDK